MRDCKNFKVRINAALAFSVPATRGCYGNTAQLTYIWDSLLVAVSAAEHVTDFAEYRYRDNFTDQVKDRSGLSICTYSTRNIVV